MKPSGHLRPEIHCSSIYITLPEFNFEPLTIRILDKLGRTVYDFKKCYSNEIIIDGLAKIKNEVYLLEVFDSSGKLILIKKLLKT